MTLFYLLLAGAGAYYYYQMTPISGLITIDGDEFTWDVRKREGSGFEYTAVNTSTGATSTSPQGYDTRELATRALASLLGISYNLLMSSKV
jgi:hypothetical protein